MKPEGHWEYVYALCSRKYDMRAVKQVYIYGDGAAWIKKSFEVFPWAAHVLDGFHFKKRMKSLLAGEVCGPYGFVLSCAIEKDDKIGFSKTVQNMISAIKEKMPESKERVGRIKNVKENKAYILKHWDAVQNMKRQDVIGSCTEAMVSNALSERFSRSPMGWSKEGLSKMSMIRVFVLNGGKVAPADTLAWKHKPDKCYVITGLEKYDAIVKKQQEEIFKDAKNWRWFEVDYLISGKTTGTKVALDALGRTRDIA
jgi:hypothetical protein